MMSEDEVLYTWNRWNCKC